MRAILTSTAAARLATTMLVAPLAAPSLGLESPQALAAGAAGGIGGGAVSAVGSAAARAPAPARVSVAAV